MKVILKFINIDKGGIFWYKRQTWIVSIGLLILLDFWFHWINITPGYYTFMSKFMHYLIYIANGFYIALNSFSSLIYKNGIVNWNMIFQYIIFYYIILGLLFYLTFRKEKVNILFPILITIIIVISICGAANTMI